MNETESSFDVLHHQRQTMHPLIKSENCFIALFIQPNLFVFVCKNNDVFSGL